jgi:hypothetical protein
MGNVAEASKAHWIFFFNHKSAFNDFTAGTAVQQCTAKEISRPIAKVLSAPTALR